MKTHSAVSGLVLQEWSLTILLMMWIFDEVFRFGIACAGETDAPASVSQVRPVVAQGTALTSVSVSGFLQPLRSQGRVWI